MLPARLKFGWMETFEVWMSFSATPPCYSAAVTAPALELSSTSDAWALGSVTLTATDTVSRSGVAEAFPVPCTVSLGAELAHAADTDPVLPDAEAVPLDAASPRATPPTTR